MLKFIKGGVYHIYNEGCGQQAVFFQQRNYRYFMKKISTYIHPYAEVLACKLMLNKIHLVVKIKHLELFIPERNRMRTFAASIGILLRSYAQAINKQEQRKGVLWQGPTKADHYSIFDEDETISELQEYEEKETTLFEKTPVISLQKKSLKQFPKSFQNWNFSKLIHRQLYILFSGAWQKTWTIFRILLLMLLVVSIELCPLQATEGKLEKHYKLNSFLNLLA